MLGRLENSVDATIVVYDVMGKVTRSRENPNLLVGRDHHSGYDLRLEGPIGPDIKRTWFKYTWTGKMPQDHVRDGYFKLGSLSVDSCKQLLLTSEIAASTTCESHIKLNDLAKTLFGDVGTQVSLKAEFRMQPDGNWVPIKVLYKNPTIE